MYRSNYGSWHQQISYIKEKAWTRINITRRLKFVLDRKSLETIYISLFRPILEYGNEIWDNCQQYEKHDLEKIQIGAARIATGRTKLVSIYIVEFFRHPSEKAKFGSFLQNGKSSYTSLFIVSYTTHCQRNISI